ncbi:hypothetical protein VNO78_00556 [Psophocarpus tetragonolobus]|uniref:Uncharacterized protein n=1 Tax=Psophocarpus tetragonolobus TaxID=3891 RepID=A0AAN9XV29_PSOTE
MPMKKSLWIALVTIMLVLSSQLCLVHSRVLRSKAADDCVELKGSDSSSIRRGLFVVSSHNSSTSDSIRLAYSGPSKKGPGH